MPPWLTTALELAKLWQTQTAAAVVLVAAILAWMALKWVRGHHCQTLILMREVGIHMIQNRPPTDSATRLHENLNWWDGKVIEVLPKAGATKGEIGDFRALGNVYHPTVIAEKIARLSEIIRRLEGRL